MKKNLRTCYLCGIREQKLTKDHVPPKCLFPSPRPSNLVTLDCCIDCQKEYQKEEEVFRQDITSISNLGSNEKAKEIWQKIRRSHLGRRSKKIEMMKRFFNAEITTKSGIYIGKEIAIKIPEEIIVKISSKIAKGLLYYHLQQMISIDYEVEVSFMPSVFPDMLRSCRFRNDYNNIFSYLGDESIDSNSSIWWMQFYDSIVIGVVFIAPEDQSKILY